jgi:methylenetetrahydrofolate dehydrogenase (NADP+) / methenyltetrahydrofolate cyclohydrolase
MILLDGKTLSEKILSDLKRSDLSKISLHVILVGDDPASVKYVSLKQKKCQELGIDFQLHHLPQTTAESKLLSLVKTLNRDTTVTGFFIQLPLPSIFDPPKILNSIDPQKDVDGLNPHSGFSPAVVVGIVKLLENYHLDFSKKNIVIVNDSDLIGQPLKKVLESKGGLVTLANGQTSSLPLVSQDADILISATGVKNLITADMVKDSAVVVDVANGDVDFAAVSPKCSYITPTFGGVGPMTVACLLYNLVNHAHPTF